MREQKKSSDVAILQFMEGDMDANEVVNLAADSVHDTKELWMLAKMTKDVNRDLERHREPKERIR